MSTGQISMTSQSIVQGCARGGGAGGQESFPVLWLGVVRPCAAPFFGSPFFRLEIVVDCHALHLVPASCCDDGDEVVLVVAELWLW